MAYPQEGRIRRKPPTSHCRVWDEKGGDRGLKLDRNAGFPFASHDNVAAQCCVLQHVAVKPLCGISWTVGMSFLGVE